MSKAIVVLGNGFDLDLGLRTSYSDFAKSIQWQELMETNSHSSDSSWLIGFLKSKYEIQLWIDIEAALLEYATIKTKNNSFEHAADDSSDFFALCQALKTYLREQQDNFQPSYHSPALAFLKFLGRLSNQSRVYSFNYTKLNVLANKCGITMGHDAKHIHGSLDEDDDIILGIETSERIDDHYAFLFKTQSRKYNHSNLLKDLKEKDEYIFYGHSLNGMDYSYFNSLFISLVSGITTPHLTIITKDETEEYKFKNFLRNKRISLQGLYSNAIPCFILTDLLYDNDKAELQKFADLFERTKSM